MFALGGRGIQPAAIAADDRRGVLPPRAARSGRGRRPACASSGRGVWPAIVHDGRGVWPNSLSAASNRRLNSSSAASAGRSSSSSTASGMGRKNSSSLVCRERGGLADVLLCPERPPAELLVGREWRREAVSQATKDLKNWIA